MIKYLPEIIAECGAVYVGYEEATLICSEFERLKNELSGCEFAHVSALLTELRRTKSEDEVKKMAAAQDIADAAFSHILGFINPSRTEAEVACELEYFMKKNGAGRHRVRDDRRIGQVLVLASRITRAAPARAGIPHDGLRCDS